MMRFIVLVCAVLNLTGCLWTYNSGAIRCEEQRFFSKCEYYNCIKTREMVRMRMLLEEGYD